jgi:DNA polymerase-1
MSIDYLVLFDGNALVHRAYHAIPSLTTKNGEPVNAVFGFASMLLKVLKDFNPKYVAVAFDTKAPTFRHLMFDGYKAQRKPTPPDLIQQLERTRELVRSFNIPVMEIDGYEADDILGAASMRAKPDELEVIIVTGDADTMQLVKNGVSILYPKAGRQFSDATLINEVEVEKKFGIKPAYVTDYKALVGDPSDNIPGIPGIGPKTAVKLITEYGTLEEIYRNIDSVKPEKLRQLLVENEATGKQSKVLATILVDIPLNFNLEACRTTNYDRNRVLDLFQKLEFSSLLPKLPLDDLSIVEKSEQHYLGQISLQKQACNYKIISNRQDLASTINLLKAAGRFSFDTETSGLDFNHAGVVGLSFSCQTSQAYYVPLGHVTFEHIKQLDTRDVADDLKPLMEDESITKIAHNAKFDIQAMASIGIDVRGLNFDTMIAAYLLGEKALGLKELAFNHLGIEMTPIRDLIGSGTKQLNMSQVDISSAADYACADADMTMRLATIFESELKSQQLDRLFYQVEMPLMPILLGMERAGILLKAERLESLSHELAKRLIELEQGIYREIGHRFNINSPKQLSQVLFDDLKLAGSKKTKSGYSTDAAVLESLKGTHPVVDLIIEFRYLSKIKSTYVDALPALVNNYTGRLHTSFNQTRTATGRLSSSDPNLQNIPVRGDMGIQIRQAFVAPAGCLLLSADYSQIDLRVLAHLSHDDVLIKTFIDNQDVHTATAMQLFGVAPDKVTADMRRLAKTVNFGVIYGMSGYGLEQATDLNRGEAEQFITTYFSKYPAVAKYLEEIRQLARKQGYVQTVLGRRRMIPEINSTNRNIREGAERIAINMPVQGTSADIIKVAMINIHNEIKKRQLSSRMLLQVHDELLFEVPNGERETMCRMVSELMSQAIRLDVPVKVDLKIGSDWGQMEPLVA